MQGAGKKVGRKRQIVAGKNLTTGQMARLCSLSLQTVIRSFDRGEIEGGFVTHGSNHRRIPWYAYIAFAKAKDIPVVCDDVSVESVVLGDANQIILNRQIFTTGEVAQICGVVSKTVCRWIDSGKLIAHRIPSLRKDRRITLPNLTCFMEANGIPLPLLSTLSGKSEEHIRVAIFCVQASLLEGVLKNSGHSLEFMKPNFEGGMVIKQFRPHFAVFDLRHGQVPLFVDIVKSIKRCVDIRNPITTIGLQRDLNSKRQDFFDHIVSTPHSVNEVISKLSG